MSDTKVMLSTSMLSFLGKSHGREAFCFSVCKMGSIHPTGLRGDTEEDVYHSIRGGSEELEPPGHFITGTMKQWNACAVGKA